MKECPECKKEWDDKVLFCPVHGQPLVEKIEEDPFIGTLLDNKYRLKEKIGEGGYGTVYKATHIEIDHTVAVKILHPHLASDRITIERFRREARAAAQIRHPNAVVVTDFGVTKDEGTAYLVMEFLEGIDLRSKIKQLKQLDYQDAILIIAQACEAVHAAHLKGIIHRDLKPDNIWLTKTDDAFEQVKVLDFGIAKLKAGGIQAGSSAVDLTQQGMIIGTPHYMSPEQGRGEELDTSSDIYSLGVILYEMVTGKVPFNGKSALEVVLKHNTNPPVSPRKLRADVPERLESAIMRALEKKQENRQASALGLAEELEAVLFDFGVPLNQVRKRNSQFGFKYIQVEMEPSAPLNDSSTKAFNSGRDNLGSLQTEDAPANQTLPISNREGTAKPAEFSPTPQIAPSPTAQPQGQVTTGSMTTTPFRNKKLLLYAGLSVVALVIAIFAISKLLSNDTTATNSNTATPARTDNKPPSGMILVRGGKFQMGTDNPATPDEADATPAHEVELQAFYLDAKEVTNEDYYQFIKATNRPAPQHWKDGEPDPGETTLPVTNISWDDAKEYAKSIGKRLPTEAEWEYAARGTEGSIYPWGNTWDPKCSNSKEDEAGGKGEKPVAVGSYKNCPSWCGIYDMAGNVAEWVGDDFRLYENSKAKPPNGQFKVYRGGAYNISKDELKTYIRWYARPYAKELWLGFRCAKDVPKTENR